MGDAPSLARLEAPKIRGITTWPKGVHPLRGSRCDACGVEGFVERIGDTLEARLERAPVDGVELLMHARGMAAHPEPWLTYLMSRALFEALDAEGMASGLQAFPFVRAGGRRNKPYVWLLPAIRLRPMATPFGRDPELRNCDVCGFVNAAKARFPLYPRPETGADWFLAPPWSATSILASRRVWDFLLGPGRELHASAGAKVNPLPAGFWPDDRDRAFGDAG